MVRRRQRKKASSAGFTLLELLIVVAIIAVSAGLAGPAMHGAMVERRNAEAGYELVRLVRRTRSEAVAYGRAHLIRYDSSDAGSFTVYRGISSRCNANDWNGTIIPEGPCGDDTSLCIDQLRMEGTGEFDDGSSAIEARSEADLSPIDLCFEPTGLLLWRVGASVTGGGRFTDRNSTAGYSVEGAFLFRFVRVDDGVDTGVPRTVAVPLGGDARVIR